jgi:hypothetical protein
VKPEWFYLYGVTGRSARGIAGYVILIPTCSGLTCGAFVLFIWTLGAVTPKALMRSESE